MVVHLARIASYMALGAGAAWLGVAFWRQEVIPIQRSLFGITAGILFYQAYRLINPSGKRITHLFGQTIAQALSQWWAKHFTKSRTGLARWITGMLWGLVPCSLVYGVLALALLMLAMGLGTLPSLLILTKVSGALMQFGQKAWVRYLAALLLIVTAVYGLYRGMTLPAELLKGGFCLT
jgi:sulfite exporter TauE/SafE